MTLNPESDEDVPIVARYFIDEAGTPTLFGHRGKLLVGTEETSRYFLLGKLDVNQPDRLGESLDELRRQLLADSYFNTVPSMLPQKGRTAVAFHAKNDLAEVRYRVFHLLMQHEVHFSAVVRDKQSLLAKVQARNQTEPLYRYNENEIYDELVSELFKSSFHQADHFELVFAKRGKKDRSAALHLALQRAGNIYEQNFGVRPNHTVDVTNGTPGQFAGLQAVDYFLWALQRMYEKGEDRYWNFVWPKVRVVHDLDDTREQGFGVIYTPEKPLTLAVCARK
jgi:hypothetical protein